jgi:hypothetical protein
VLDDGNATAVVWLLAVTVASTPRNPRDLAFVVANSSGDDRKEECACYPKDTSESWENS